MGFNIPDDVTSDEDLGYWLKAAIGTIAITFDNGMTHHWPHCSAKDKDVCTDLNTNDNEQRPHFDRFENATNWGRFYIGFVWREVNNLGKPGIPTTHTQEYVKKLVDDLLEEISHTGDWIGYRWITTLDPYCQAKWYFGHHIEDWKTCLKDSDDAGSRQLRKMGDWGKCGELVYDLNAAHTDDKGVIDSDAAEDEYKNLKTVQYHEALSYLRSYVVPPKFQQDIAPQLITFSMTPNAQRHTAVATLLEKYDAEIFDIEFRTSDKTVATAELTNNDTNVTISSLAKTGTATITMIARNQRGKASLDFNVTVGAV